MNNNRLITGEKTAEQIGAMRECGRMLATIFNDLIKVIEPGMAEIEADRWVEKEIKKLGAQATYKTQEVNFPKSICISTNDQIVHSVPSEYIWKKGDVASFDLVISYKGMKTDSAFTIVVGEEPSGDKKKLLSGTKESLYAGIEAIKGETKTGDIGFAIEKVLSRQGLGIVRDLVGHGVGLKMHMPPDIPNFGSRGQGILLRPGDTIAIEPMATLGGEAINTRSEDGWTIKTADGSLSAHFEHTVLITDMGVEVLTVV